MQNCKKLTLLLFITMLMACEQCDEGIRTPKSFWEAIAGEWHLGTTYSINGEVFSVAPCDRSTIVRFRSLPGNVLKSSVPSGTTIRLDTLVYTDNKYLSCSANFLFWGTIFGKKTALPHTSDFEVNLVKECYNCLYSDIQFIDISTCITDSLPFSILNLAEDEFSVRMITNVYNRQIDNNLLLDTIRLSFVRNNPYDNIDVGPFDINSYAKVNWIRCESAFPGTTGNAFVFPDGVDGNCLFFGDRTSSVPIQNDLKSAMGADKEMTLSFWVKPQSVDYPTQILYSKYANTYGPFILSLEYDKFTLAVNNGFGTLQKVISNKSISSGTWNHIALSYKDRELLLCINGITDSKLTIQDWLYDANADILLGNSAFALSQNTEKGFVGCMDEIIFFEDYLAQGEIFQLYQWHLNN